MAFLSLNYFSTNPFNWKKFDISKFVSAYVDDEFTDDANVSPIITDRFISVELPNRTATYNREGDFLEDILEVSFNDGGSSGLGRFGGTALSFDGSGNPTGGKIVSIADTFIEYFMTDFELNAADVLSVANTPGTSDDKQLLKQIFSGNDGIKGTASDDVLNGFRGNDIIKGSDGDDKIIGGPGKDKIDGERNDDTIKSGKGNDFLFGSNGNDKLIGGKGRDYLSGGENNDTLKGGGGADTFEFLEFASKLEGNDVILGFQDDKDTIRLDKGLYDGDKTVKQVYDDHATDTGKHILLNFDLRGTILVKNVDDVSDLYNDTVLV